MDGTGHLLSLKVMRISRPSLAGAWEPFYSSSPSFSAHSTASIVSLQGKGPLPGHPKTLRDLTHVSEVLMLPSSFGAIQLGEIFTSCLSVNNEASVEVGSVTLRVEMQTASTKTVLAEFGGADQRLAVDESLEKTVSHEIKELGQHVLGCTVTYRLPHGARGIPSAMSDANDPGLQSFRKFYKFAVTNPLSVKTKVHVPRAPSALLSRAEREKVFLEVHIQNLTQDAMWLERMQFECTDGWQVQDVNHLDNEDKENIFSGSMALMHPQDTRQYIYILTPMVLGALPVSYQPGSIVPLGRLDISWRSSYGEPGRLLTSMLSRRIPLIQTPPQSQTTTQAPVPPPKQPASAIPLHLQRTASTTSGTPSRPRSPQLNQRPTSPPATGPVPYRPGSPFRNRTTTAPATGTQSPITLTSPNAALRRPEDVEVDLVCRNIPREALHVETPFNIAFTVTVSAPVPVSRLNGIRRQRVLSLVVQHLLPPRSVDATSTTAVQAAPSREPWSPRLPSSGFSTPSPYGTPYRGDFQDTLAQRLLIASPRRANEDGDEPNTDTDGAETPAPGTNLSSNAVLLPPPFAQGGSGTGDKHQSANVVPVGSSTLFLPQFRLTPPFGDVQRGFSHERNVSSSTTDSEADNELEDLSNASVKVVASQDFELLYMPLKTGFATIGGLRVVLVEDRMVHEEIIPDVSSADDGRRQYTTEVRILKEWDVISEAWISS
ncbi:hypothetical protein AcV7_009128 [Taiwanofungus camphoratus]|nr:hypothetical protein AcV7_009128 [Antrodia cinnamomea]